VRGTSSDKQGKRKREEGKREEIKKEEKKSERGKRKEERDCCLFDETRGSKIVQ
jgi:hypothetical protein